MITVEIPSLGALTLEHLVLDYNGTLAVDGDLLDGVTERLRELSQALTVHVVTADTFGKVREELAELPIEVVVLEPGAQDVAKRRFVEALGAEHTAAIGNGRNDRMMLERAALGVAVILAEGASSQTVMAADVVTTSITDALDGLLRPLRLVATLRS